MKQLEQAGGQQKVTKNKMGSDQKNEKAPPKTSKTVKHETTTEKKNKIGMDSRTKHRIQPQKRKLPSQLYVAHYYVNKENIVITGA